MDVDLCDWSLSLGFGTDYYNLAYLIHLIYVEDPPEGRRGYCAFPLTEFEEILIDGARFQSSFKFTKSDFIEEVLNPCMRYLLSTRAVENGRPRSYQLSPGKYVYVNINYCIRIYKK